MALLTELGLDAAAALAAKFGLDLRAIEPLSVGSVNSNFRLTDRSGKSYFARLYEEQDHAGAAREHALVAALDDANVPVVRALCGTGGASLADFSGKAFAIFPWLDGEILCQGKVTVDACHRLGAALARIHLCSPRAPELPEGRFRVPDLRLRLARVKSSGRSALLPAVCEIEERLDHYEARRARTLELGICHGDLFRDNVLWQNGEILALLDFESASRGNFAYDLMVTALAWCYGSVFEPSLVEALFAGYHAVRPVPALEVAELKTEGAIGCLRFATTRLTDFSLRAADGEKPARDYRRFLERLRAIEAGALDSCIASLRA
ncbi:MAG TPA: homoserine kinase [Polyangiaceae bacterium]|nr:homoserine kinase [Polyangiaceae bacterium]